MAKKEFSARQVRAIELLATGELTLGEVVTELNCSRTTLNNWRHQRAFIDAVVIRARELIREQLPQLYRAAIAYANAGKHSYFKTLLEHADRIEEMDKNSKERQIVFTWKPDNLDIDENSSGYIKPTEEEV